MILLRITTPLLKAYGNRQVRGRELSSCGIPKMSTPNVPCDPTPPTSDGLTAGGVTRDEGVYTAVVADVVGKEPSSPTARDEVTGLRGVNPRSNKEETR